jgi:hypothetical protein
MYEINLNNSVLYKTDITFDLFKKDGVFGQTPKGGRTPTKDGRHSVCCAVFFLA